jgi:hypothetical protein
MDRDESVAARGRSSMTAGLRCNRAGGCRCRTAAGWKGVRRLEKADRRLTRRARRGRGGPQRELLSGRLLLFLFPSSFLIRYSIFGDYQEPRLLAGPIFEAFPKPPAPVDSRRPRSNSRIPLALGSLHLLPLCVLCELCVSVPAPTHQSTLSRGGAGRLHEDGSPPSTWSRPRSCRDRHSGGLMVLHPRLKGPVFTSSRSS